MHPECNGHGNIAPNFWYPLIPVFLLICNITMHNAPYSKVIATQNEKFVPNPGVRQFTSSLLGYDYHFLIIFT